MTDTPQGFADARRGAVPLVAYEYQVEDRGYQGTRINFVGHSYSEAVDRAAGYEPGQQVAVWYDPERPESAVLDPYLSGSNIWAITSAVLVLSIGILMIVTSTP